MGLLVSTAQVDTLARAIAGAGLGLAMIGTLIAVLAYRRDRPRLKLMWAANQSVPELEVTTVNDGRQPVTLARVRIAERRPPLWVRWWPVVRPFRPLIRLMRGDLIYDDLAIDPMPPGLDVPVLLMPGTHCVVVFEAARVLTLADSRRGGLPWIIAIDALERRTAEELPASLVEVLRISTRGR